MTPLSEVLKTIQDCDSIDELNCWVFANEERLLENEVKSIPVSKIEELIRKVESENEARKEIGFDIRTIKVDEIINELKELIK